MTWRARQVGVLFGALGLSACSAPGAPAPVGSTSEASPSPWTWQSAEPTTQANNAAISGSETTAANSSAAPTPPAEEASRRLAYQPGVAGQPMAPVGECVDFQRAEDGHTTFANKPCDQPHQAQVVGYVDIHDGPNAPAPPLSRLQGIAARHCPILGGEFIGSALSARQDLTVNWTGPSRREWGAGARTLLCLLSGAPVSDGQGTQPLIADLRDAGHAPSTGVPVPESPQPTLQPAPTVQPAPPATTP